MKHKKRYKETKNRKKLKRIKLQKQSPVRELTPVERIEERVRKLYGKVKALPLWDRLCNRLRSGIPAEHRVNTAVLALMPILLLFVTQLITSQSGSALFWGFGHMWAALLGWFVLVGACALFYGVSGRLWLTWLLSAAPCVLVALVNHYKMELHGAPLQMNDFTLIGQFGIIAGYAMPNLRFSFPTISALLLAVALPVGLFFLEKERKLTLRARSVCAAVGAVLCVLSVFCLPGSALTARAAAGAATQDERVESAGVLTGLYCAWAGDRKKEPVVDTATLQESIQIAPTEENIPATDAEDTQSEPVAEEEVVEEPVVTPAVIFLMAESFFDITEIPTLQFETDPIPVFHSIEETSTSGKLVSNTYCGGTGYVEMEVLTGICSYLLKEADTLTSLPNETYNAMPCITDVFDQYGYRKEFIHSHNNLLYNRESIYTSFGFDSIRFSDSFPEGTEMSGGYVSDMALSEEIISIYETNRAAGDQPLMVYSVSMENHQPYTATKYGVPSEAGLSSELLSEEELAIVDSYVTGLMNADRALGRLIEYFSACEEPVMLVFWGDHLPNLKLADGSSAFEKLGWCSTGLTTDWEPDELQHMLSTDYFIWSNYGLEQEDTLTGSSMLGLQALNALNFDLTDYFRWLDATVADNCLMYRPRLFVDGDGNATKDIPEEKKGVMDLYSAVVYNMVYGDQDLFTAHRVQAEDSAPQE